MHQCHFNAKRDSGEISQDEMKEQIKLAVLDENSRLYKLGELGSVAEKLACSMGNEFYLEYSKFSDLLNKYWESLLNDPNYWKDKGKKGLADFSAIVSGAAKLQNMLEEKLISIRDNQNLGG